MGRTILFIGFVTFVCNPSLGLCDGVTFDESVVPDSFQLKMGGEKTVQIERWTEWEMGDYSESRIIAHWINDKGKACQSQMIYEGMSVGKIHVAAREDSLVLSFSGNRYEPMGYRTDIFMDWDEQGQSFVQSRVRHFDPWENNIQKLSAILQNDDFVGARAFTLRMGNSPNGGHTFETERILEIFLNAYVRRGRTLHKQGKKQAAADLLLSFFANPPLDNPQDTPDYPTYLIESSFLLASEGAPRTQITLSVTDDTTRLLEEASQLLKEGGDLRASTQITDILNQFKSSTN